MISHQVQVNCWTGFFCKMSLHQYSLTLYLLTLKPTNNNGDFNRQSKSTSPFKSVSILPTLVRMVQAKTEDGNWRTMPLYKAGMDVCYRNENEIQECKILTVHHNDLLEPYYTVRLLDGKEKQTDNIHIMLRLQDGKKCNEEGMTHQDIAREQGAQRAFILQKQRMKKGKRTKNKKYWESLPPIFHLGGKTHCALNCGTY